MRFYALLGDLRALFGIRKYKAWEIPDLLRKGTWTHARGMWGLSPAGCFTSGG